MRRIVVLMRRAALFDLDGTLIDSSALHAKAFSTAVRLWWKPCEVPVGTDLTTKQKMEMIGVPEELREDIQSATRKTTLDLIPKMVPHNNRLNAEMVDLCLDFSVGVVTNARRKPAEMMLKKMGLWDTVEVLVTSEDGKHKPAPDLYLVAKERVPRATGFVAVEDSDTGEEAATAAGIPCLRVNGPQDITAKLVRDFCGHR